MSVTACNAKSGADRVAEHRARKLARIPDRIFDAILSDDGPPPGEATIVRRAEEIEDRLRAQGHEI